MGIDSDRVVACPITQMVKDCLADSGMDNKGILKCRNMFALGVVCWLFNRDVTLVENFLREKFAKKPQIAENNIKVVNAGYNYGHNVHAGVPATYRIESKHKVKGRYMDITGNKATAYGLIAAAEKAGMKAGAQILAVNGKAISTWNDFDFNVTLRRQDILGAPTCTRQDSLKQRHLLVVWTADGGVTKDTASLHLDETYLMGVTRRLPEFGTEHESYTLLSCIPAGLKRGWKQLSGYVNDLKYMASADGVKSVGSFITIGSIFPSAWDWQQFWLTTAFISIILAVMNLLPIPALDGGHLFFLLVEAITGRQPSEKVMQWMEMIGLGLLAILMLVAFSNDVRNFILPLFGF